MPSHREAAPYKRWTKIQKLLKISIGGGLDSIFTEEPLSNNDNTVQSGYENNVKTV